MRISRKDIRRPDRFVTLTGNLFHLLRERKTPLVVILSVLLAASFAFWGWQLYKERQDRLAGLSYSRGVTHYHNRKYKEALEELSHTTSYRFSTYSRLALLYQANSYVALNQSTLAVQTLEEFLRRETKDHLLRQSAFLTLGYAHERASNPALAFKAFSEGEKLSGPFKEELLLGQARSAALNGDFKNAVAAYRRYLSNYPGSQRVSEIELRVSELEGMAQSQAAGK